MSSVPVLYHSGEMMRDYDNASTAATTSSTKGRAQMGMYSLSQHNG